VRLSPTEIAQRRKDNRCFHCDELFTQGHKQQCKQLFVIEMLGDDDETNPPPLDTEPTISIAALTGIQPRKGRTMQVFVTIHGIVLRALLDSRSTHNFVDSEAAARVGIVFGTQAGLSVTVANGDHVSSSGCCNNLKIFIAGDEFIINCYGLALGSYDMVLGVQWLESLGPILWDFKNNTISFVRHGRAVRWSASAPPDPLGPTITAASGEILEELLLQFVALFVEPTGLPSQRHQIRLLPGTPPVAVRPYRYVQHQKQELEQQCTEMLRQGVIRPSSSAFAALILLVTKSDGSWRFCVDYHALNASTVKDKFPIPVVEELLDELRGAKFFSKLDLRSGYHQVRMHVDDVEKTAFQTHEGLFEFLVMPFGLTNTPATFQALMNDVLRPFLRRFVLVFFDDILVYSSSWEEHLRHLHLVFTKLQEQALFVKRSKCAFGERTVAYLGHVISEDGVAMDAAKVRAVLDWPRPQSVHTVRSFLGLAGYYRRFIKDYSAIAEPLMQLLRKSGFRWTGEETAFHNLQQALTSAPVLQLPDFNHEFVVECDASSSGIGAVLHQGGGLIAFFSHQIAPRHSKLAAYERELIGLVQAVWHWRAYLWGRAFMVKMDHYSLKYPLDQRLATIPQHQWVSKLMGFDFRVEYKPGKSNMVADALSRRETEEGQLVALSTPSFKLFDDLRSKTNDFPINVGLHQGSALSPYLFSLVMDEVTRDIQGGIPWCMLFADDVVLVDE
jgi:hypothetical protein